MKPHILNTALTANLAALIDGLEQAVVLANSAQKAFGDNHPNQAIGTILPLERDLPMLAGLLTAVLTLHRRQGQGGEA